MSTNRPTTDSARVLLVDDDAMWRFLTAEALRERGFEVIELETAVDIEREVDLAAPELVILDAMMPQVDGFSACATLRERARWTLLPILMMTGLEDDTAISRAYEAGATDFFIKSNHWALLVERVRHLLRLSEMQAELIASHAQLAKAQSAGRVGSFELDLDARTLTGATGSFTVLGFDEYMTALPASVFFAMMEPADARRIEAAVAATLRSGERLRVDVPLRAADGRRRSVELDAEAWRDEDGRARGVRGLIRDVTESVEAREEIRRLATSDPLTGLPNRTHFLSRCADALAAARTNGRQLAVAVIDLDRFTHINESYGQVAGDDLLCQLGRRLSAELEAMSTAGGDTPAARELDRPLLARLAGDDFAVLMPRVSDAAEVETRLEALQRAYARPFVVAGHECVISASVGVAMFPADGDSAGLLLSRADVAISAVKSAGRNGINWYSASQDHEGRVRLELAHALHRALEVGELELHYQAIVDFPKGSIAGVEALMRWRRGDALVPPGDFIPLAEETGLIIPMGEWAVREACRQVARWRSEGVDVGFVAVNLPSSHFERSSLPMLVRTAMEDNGLGPGAVELEITETGLMRDLERTLPRLDQLREAGVVISIDDFGTGYSSLAYLTRLPIGKLKIDRSFVRDMADTRHASTVVRAVVALGHGLGLDVVAEGVETREQAHALAGLGCAQMQGFLFARPVPAASLGAALRSAMATMSSLREPAVTAASQPASPAAAAPVPKASPAPEPPRRRRIAAAAAVDVETVSAAERHG